VDTAIAQNLDYAAPRVARGGRPWFRTALALFAVGGIFANGAFIAGLTRQLFESWWVYHDLMQNPKAYGREIDPEIIASPRDLRPLWVAAGAFGIAAAFGLLLAINLLVAAALFESKPASADRRLTRYRRYKPLGIVATAVTFFWVAIVNHDYWVAATRHVPVGSGPPIVETAVLVLCALVPWWWAGKRSAG
jgi:hypothetical protein